MEQIAALRVRLEDAGRVEEALAQLLPREPELAYGNFPPLATAPDAVQSLHRARWLDPALHIGTLVARDASERAIGCLRLVERPFESAHFGLRMAAIETPLAVPEPAPRLSALRALVGFALRELRARGYAHVAARASCTDRAAPWALQEAGAFHVGTQVSWTCRLDGARRRDPVPPQVALEVHDRASLAGLPETAWKRIAEWSRVAFDRGPFLFDQGVADDQALHLYQIWMEKVMSGEWADGAVLARERGEVVAIVSMRLVEDVSRLCGMPVYGRSLAATLPEHRGLCTALMREMIAVRPFGADWMEGDTPVTTWGTINMFAKVGFRYLRAASVFHRRLDAASGAGAP